MTQTDPTSSQGPSIEGYINKGELARRLKKSVRTVENWQRRGIIPFVKAGHSTLFNWQVVQQHLDANYGNNPRRLN